MVKQGHYAEVSRQKRLRQLKQRHQGHEQRAIAPAAVPEFLQVRYHLTRAKKQRPISRKTMQRFVAQWLTAAQATIPNWSVRAVTKQTLQAFNRQLPWQGYAVIAQAIMDFQDFLIKEAPAVPLEQRLQVSETMTPTEWQTLLTTQLAVNALLGLVSDLSQVTTEQVTQLQQSLITGDGKVDWDKVASLVTPVTSEIPDADTATMAWLNQLTGLTVDEFD